MKKINIGSLRFIELYNEKDEDESHKYDAYINSFNLDMQLGNDFQVIGSINGMEPIFMMKNGNKEIITVHDSVPNQLIIIAADKNQLYEIILDITRIWDDYPDEMFLPRNDQTTLLYKEFVKKWIKKKEIDYGYWIGFAFKELDIRYEV